MTTFHYPDDFVGTLWNALTGALYVALEGSDSRGDGSPKLPYRTIQQAINIASPGQIIVIGAGTYTEVLDGQQKSLQLIADGFCAIAGVQTGAALSNWGNAPSSKIQGLGFFQNATILDGPIALLQNCYFFDGEIRNFGGTFSHCLIYRGELGAPFDTEFINCTLDDAKIDNRINRITRLKNCFIGNATQMELFTSILLDFDYCNFYTADLFIDGTFPQSLSALQLAFPQYQQNGISAAPQFNGTFLEYSLSSSSPMINAGEGGTFMGAYGPGYSFHPAAMGRDAVLSDVATSPIGAFCLPQDPTITQGTIDSGEIDLGGVQALGRIRLFGNQDFDNRGQFGVVDTDPLNGNPTQLKYEMRFSNIPGEIATLPWKTFIWNNFPTVDQYGYGNGDLAFDALSAELIITQYIQFRVTLRAGTLTSLLLQQNYFRLLTEDQCNLQIN